MCAWLQACFNIHVSAEALKLPLLCSSSVSNENIAPARGPQTAVHRSHARVPSLFVRASEGGPMRLESRPPGTRWALTEPRCRTAPYLV